MGADLGRIAAEILQANPGLGAEANALQAILTACDLMAFTPGQILCSEEEEGDAMYFLLQGEIEVSRRVGEGQQQRVGLIRAPAMTGQIALLDHTRRSASLIATTAGQVATLPRPLFDRLIRSMEPTGLTLRRLLLSSLTRQLLEANANLRRLMSAAPEGQPRPDHA